MPPESFDPAAGSRPSPGARAEESGDPADWNAIASDPDFRALLRAKARFIAPWTVFFLAYYLTLPVLIGFFPDAMKKPVWGAVNWAYLFALSQFVMTGVLCLLYVRAARRWDRMNAALLEKYRR